MVRLVILDVEGVITLPGGSQHPWPLQQLLAIRSFLSTSPVAVVLCTGRQEPYGEAVIQALNLFYPLPEPVADAVETSAGLRFSAWPSVLENGAYFYDPISKRPIPNPSLTGGQIEALGRLRSEVITPLALRTGAQVEAGKDFCISINPPLVAGSQFERESTQSFRPIVDAALGAHAANVIVHHSASAVDITPLGVSKATAVRCLREWTGLKPEEILGVGDTRADELWLQEVGWRAAPANGREQLPGMHFYSEYSVAEGLLDILERLKARDYSGIS